jgi:putative addiction module CopG family antidote
MRSTQQLSITLPIDMANLVKEKVSAGEYASESEVIRDGIRALLARDRAVDAWLSSSIGPSYDATKAKPSRSVSATAIKERLQREHHNASSESL